MGLFYKKYRFQTAWQKEELLERLKAETDTFDRDGSTKSFEGKVLPSGKFVLKSLIDFHARNQFRPDIHFTVTDQNVAVVFQLNPTMKFFIPFLILFNTGVGLFFYFKLKDTQFLLLIPFILIFMGMMALQFRSKTRKSVQVLERIFEVTAEVL